MQAPIILDSRAVFDDGALFLALGVTANTLAAARRAGRLRFTRQGKRTLYLGQWVLDWLESEAPATGRAVKRDQ